MPNLVLPLLVLPLLILAGSSLIGRIVFDIAHKSQAGKWCSASGNACIAVLLVISAIEAWPAAPFQCYLNAMLAAAFTYATYWYVTKFR